MIVKVEDDTYINLELVKTFQIKVSEWNGGISIYIDGIEMYGGESIDINENYCKAVIKEFEEAMINKDWFFDLSQYLADDVDDFVDSVLKKHGLYDGCNTCSKKNSCEDKS